MAEEGPTLDSVQDSPSADDAAVDKDDENPVCEVDRSVSWLPPAPPAPLPRERFAPARGMTGSAEPAEHTEAPPVTPATPATPGTPGCRGLPQNIAGETRHAAYDETSIIRRSVPNSY